MLWVLVGMAAFLVGVAGLISIIVPLRPIGIKTRYRGLILAGAASAVFLFSASQLPAELEKKTASSSPAVTQSEPQQSSKPHNRTDDIDDLDTDTPGENDYTAPPEKIEIDQNAPTPRNMRLVLNGLKAAKLKFEPIGERPCQHNLFCSVIVGDIQVNATGYLVDVMVSNSDPVKKYIQTCAATLSGLASVDTESALGYVTQGFREASQSGDVKYRISGTEMRVRSSLDSRLECGFFKK